MNIDRSGLDQLQLAVSNSGEIEQVIDQSSFELYVAPHHAELRAKLRLDRTFLLQGSHAHEHWGQRRSQLMRKSGKEIVFGAVGVFRLFSGATRLFMRGAQFRYNPLTLDDFHF